jgi:5-methylcytosine-specific restriction protein A
MQPCPNHPKPKSYVEDRESSYDRGYDNEWRKFRTWYLRRHPVCKCCGNKATLVHHIIAIEDDGERLDARNCIALCHICHEKMHGRMK